MPCRALRAVLRRLAPCLCLLLLLQIPLGARADDLEEACRQADTPDGVACYETAVRRLLQHWVGARAAGDADAYFALYTSDVSPRSGLPRAAWMADRRQRLATAEQVVIALELDSMALDDDGNVDVIFVEHYRSADYSDVLRKQLFLVRDGAGLRIRREVVLD